MRNQHKSSSPYPEWNNKKFEAKLEREIEQRKNLISISANYILPDKENALGYHSDNPNGEILESTGIYKQFLLIGVPPSVENSRDPNVKPTVLIAYPPFEYPNMPIKKIIDHCMPTGPSREFLSTNSLTPIQDEFVFQFGGGLGSDGKPIYGVCVHVSTKDTSLPFYGSKNDKDRIFCFCLMTKMPIFSVHFAFLTSLVLWTIGHVRHLHKYENKIRVNIPPGEPIDDLDLEDQIGHHPSVEVPVSFQNEIAAYFISNISSKPEMLSRASNTFMQGYVSRKLEKMNNKRHNFHYETEDCSIELRFPPIKDISENCIEWASLDTLFSLLSAEDILMIISGLLLDRQVLIIGSRLEEVSMTVWALKSILRPFKFAGTVIPILPTTSEDYIGLLQLPTPFLFGVPRCNELKVIKFLETAVFVDLDKRNVPPIEDLPDYPNENYVRSKLNKFISSIKSKKESNEFGLPAIYKKTLNHKYIFSTASCQKINEIIGSPFENSIYSNYICGFFVSAEGVTVFNEELFLGQIFSMLTSGPEELYGETNPYPIREKDKEKKINEEFEFWSNIVESQTFQMYIEERMQSFMELKNRAINGNDLIENEEDKEDEKNEDDIQKIAQLSEEINISDNNEDIKDIDKNKSSLPKRKTLYNFDQIEHLSSNHGKNEAEVPQSSPPRISINRKKIQLKNPQRIKSLKNVLDDLPTPCSSNNKLLDLNEDRVKSDADVSIEDNENIKLPNKKIRKSSTLAAINRSDFFLEEEDDEVKKEDKKSTNKKAKNLNKKADDDEPEKVNNDKNQKNKQNKQQQKQRKSSNTSDHDEQNNENSDEEAAKKLKKSNSNDNKQTKKNLNNNKNENKNNNSDDEEITKKQKKSNDAKKVTSKSQPVRRSPLVNQTDSSSEEEEMTKKRRKSIPKDNKQETANQVKRTSSNDKVDDKNKKVDEEDASKKHRKSDAKKVTSKSQKPTRTRLVKSDEQNSSDDEENTKKRRKSSSNENKQTTSKQAKKTSSNDKVDEENIKSDEEDVSKKHRKSDAKKVTSRSQKPTRNQIVKSDEQNSSDDEEIVKKRRKSSEAKRTTSRSQKPTRAALINNDDDQESDEKITNRRRKSSEVKQTTSRSQKPTRTALNKEDSLDEEIENEFSKKRRKSSDVKHSTRHTRKSSSTNDDDENDNKKHRRSSTSSRSSKPTRKSSNTNESDSSEDDEELMKERNVKLRKSNSNDKTKQTRKSSNDNDEDENTKEKKHRKSVSNSKSKPARKSSNNDDDDDDENIKERNLKHRKSVSNERFKPTRKSSNNDDDDDDNELKNQKLRRKSAQSKSTHNFNEKVHRKSNEDDNIRTKSTKNQDPANKKTSNPMKKVINKPRSKSTMNKPDRKNDNDSNKKKAQLQFNSSSDSETYSSDSINPNLYYANEEMDRSSESYDD